MIAKMQETSINNGNLKWSCDFSSKDNDWTLTQKLCFTEDNALMLQEQHTVHMCTWYH